MKQCPNCQRLAHFYSNSCIECNSDNLVEIRFDKEIEFPFTRININKIHIDGTTYTIDNLLGTGGFSVVFALGGPDREKYALKVPFKFLQAFTQGHQPYSESFMINSEKYIEREINYYQKLKSENILKCFYGGLVECHSEGNQIEIPMLLLERAICTLDDLIINSGLALNTKDKSQMIKDMLSGLQDLHDTGFLHRDLSPSNLFVVERDGGFKFVLGDFGISKPEADHSISSALVAKPKYMDPRCNEIGFKRDERSDIYSAGLIATEIILNDDYLSVIDNSVTESQVFRNFPKAILDKFLKKRLPKPLHQFLYKCTDVHFWKSFKKIKEVIKHYQNKIEPDPDNLKIIFPPVNLNIHVDCEVIADLLKFEKSGDVESTIHYSGGSDILIDDLTDFCVKFNTPVKGAKIKGTKLFSPEIRENKVSFKLDRGSDLLKSDKDLSFNFKCLVEFG